MSTPINQVSPKQEILFGLLVAGAGALILLRAADIIQAGAMQAPPWVVGLAGFLFFLVGLCLLFSGIRNAVRPWRAVEAPAAARFQFGGWLLGGSILAGLGLIGAWVAFGPGERAFEGGITGSPIEGRIVFGLGAVITLLLAASAWVHGLRHLLGGRGTSRPAGPPPPASPRRPPRR